MFNFDDNNSYLRYVNLIASIDQKFFLDVKDLDKKSVEYENYYAKYVEDINNVLSSIKDYNMIDCVLNELLGMSIISSKTMIFILEDAYIKLVSLLPKIEGKSSLEPGLKTMLMIDACNRQNKLDYSGNENFVEFNNNLNIAYDFANTLNKYSTLCCLDAISMITDKHACNDKLVFFALKLMYDY